MGTGDGVRPVWLHAVANNANAITRINRATVSTPTRKTALSPLQPGDASIPISGVFRRGLRAELKCIAAREGWRQCAESEASALRRKARQFEVRRSSGVRRCPARRRACSHSAKSLAHPPPLVGADIARPRDGRSPERPMGGGSHGRRGLSNAPSLARRVGRRDPPPRSSPTIGRPKDARPLDGLWGEEAQRSDPARKFQSKKLKNR